jgi:hypothetical protein
MLIIKTKTNAENTAKPIKMGRRKQQKSSNIRKEKQIAKGQIAFLHNPKKASQTSRKTQERKRQTRQQTRQTKEIRLRLQ